MFNRKQKIKTNETLSSWKDIVIVGPLLFNIHLCDLFYFLEYLATSSYANDTSGYAVKENKDSVINNLEASLRHSSHGSITTL